VRADRVDKGRGRVAHQQHVAALDRLEAANRGTIKAQAIFEKIIFIIQINRHRKMLPLTVKIGEFQIDEFNAVFSNSFGHILDRTTVETHNQAPTT
jgi:hypothetical protein